MGDELSVESGHRLLAADVFGTGRGSPRGAENITNNGLVQGVRLASADSQLFFACFCSVFVQKITQKLSVESGYRLLMCLALVGVAQGVLKT